MNHLESKTTQSDDLGLRFKVVFMEDAVMPVDTGVVETDTYFYFAAPIDTNRWFAFTAISEEYDPAEIVSDYVNEPDLLKRLSAYMGEPWGMIAKSCPHCSALKHRERRASLTDEVLDDIMAMDYADLETAGSHGIGLAIYDMLLGVHGVSYSMN